MGLLEDMAGHMNAKTVPCPVCEEPLRDSLTDAGASFEHCSRHTATEWLGVIASDRLRTLSISAGLRNAENENAMMRQLVTAVMRRAGLDRIVFDADDIDNAPPVKTAYNDPKALQISVSVPT